MKYSKFSDETEEIKAEKEFRNKQTTKDAKEENPKTTAKVHKDIFRPYCLKDPDIKPLNSPFNFKVSFIYYYLILYWIQDFYATILHTY